MTTCVLLLNFPQPSEYFVIPELGYQDAKLRQGRYQTIPSRYLYRAGTRGRRISTEREHAREKYVN